jgi:transcriptional regulator with XRE-family HTH domain
MNLLTTAQVELELGRRLKRRRLELNLSQETAAQRSGLSRRTITAIEHGKGATLATFIELLRTLDALDQMEEILRDTGPSPLVLAGLKEDPVRLYASKPRRPANPAAWKWGDEK